jgi:hypothetical protein
MAQHQIERAPARKKTVQNRSSPLTSRWIARAFTCASIISGGRDLTTAGVSVRPGATTLTVMP